MYRKELDGLRAIAVLGVLAFHFQLGNWASGGFIGVDIFFVISGYLITNLILTAIGTGAFSLTEFYHRRVSRIFPALFTVFLACILASGFLDYEIEIHQFARSLFSSIVFVSNILFYTTSDYFSPLAEADPLLHTWSLSVEEQFYLFFPLLLLGMKRWTPRSRNIALQFLAVLSFAWACRTVEVDKTAAFYLLPSRAWEFLLGALLASRNLPVPSNRWLAEAASTLGLTLVLASIVLIDTSMPFPGALAAAPCLGAAAIIYGGGQTWAGHILSLTPVRYVGLISYSLYLWHWPVLTYYRRVDDLHGLERIALLGVCFVLAALSYHLIEKPFRERGRMQRTGRVLAAGATAMAVCAVLGIGLSRVALAFHPTSEAVTSVLSYVRYDLSSRVREGSCFLTERTGGFIRFKPEECLAEDRVRRNVLLLGDSYAAHLWPGLKQIHGKVHILQATASLCKPLLPAQGERRCRDLLEYLTQTYLPSHRPDELVLAARWHAEDLDALKHTVELLRSFTDRIVVIGPIVEYEQALPRVLARAMQSDTTLLLDAYRSPVPGEADRALAAGLAEAPVTYVSLLDILCTPDCVVWAKPGRPLQFDAGHLTRAGSIEVASRLDPMLFQKAAALVRSPPALSANGP